MSICIAWSPVAPCPPGVTGTPPRAPICSRYARFPGISAAASSAACARRVKDGRLERIEDPTQVERVLKALMATEWVVYSKPALAATQTVVDYLGRYSHRIALSDSRLLDFSGESVAVAYTDYRDGDRRKVMTLSGEELIRRFLLHVLPKGFMRVRHFGFLANRCRAQRLAQIRTALAAPPTAASPEPETTPPFDGYPCPTCRTGRLQVRAHLLPLPRSQAPGVIPLATLR